MSGVIFLDERTNPEPGSPPDSNGGFALYIDGDFQFDTSDEALYHESMALPALSLSAARVDDPHNLRVLICGGGDGLALRECLRFPGVVGVDLVDYSSEVIALGRTRFAEINQGAFADDRVRVHIADAWDYLANASTYDVILCDFTVPHTDEDARVFTQEWYALLERSLAPGGVICLNAVSPQVSSEAFWCLNRTVRSAGLKPLPFRVCIPSFRAHGYGAWGFILATKRRLFLSDLKRIDCPVSTRQANLSRLYRGAHFSKTERNAASMAPINTLDRPCLAGLLLNSASSGAQREPLEGSPFDLDPLLAAIPISHPYHTRIMVETLAAQVAGSVRDLDIRRLLDALMRKISTLPAAVAAELTRLRDYLKDHRLRFELFSEWSYRLFATLVIMMTLANAIAPDNAFAKGSMGMGGHGGVSVSHSSFGSRAGFSSSGRAGGSFGGARGFSESGRGGSGSFGSSGRGVSSGSFGNSGSFYANRSVMSAPSSPHFTGAGFRTSYGNGRAVDIYGSYEPARVYSYCGSGYGHYHPYTQLGGGQPSPAPPEKHQALFLASDDMSVLDNGDVVVTVSDSSFLLLTNGTVALMSNRSPEPVMMLYPDPELFANVQDQISRQLGGVQNAVVSRRDWLSWVGWTSVMLPAVAGDKMELRNLQDLSKKLEVALVRLGAPPAGATVATRSPDQLELFIGGVLTSDGSILLRDGSGKWLRTDGKTIQDANASDARTGKPCPPALVGIIRSALEQARKETTGGVASDQHDMQQLDGDYSSLQSDLSQYQSLEAQNYGDPGYQVDYGTDEIPVGDAINRTNNDLAQNFTDRTNTSKDIDLLQRQLAHIDSALAYFPQ